MNEIIPDLVRFDAEATQKERNAYATGADVERVIVIDHVLDLAEKEKDPTVREVLNQLADDFAAKRHIGRAIKSKEDVQ